MKNQKITVVIMLIAVLLLITACNGKKNDYTQNTDESTSTEVSTEEETTVEEHTDEKTTDEEPIATAEPKDDENQEATNEEPTETEIETPELVWSVKHENKLYSICVSPSVQTVTVGEFMTGYSYRLADGELVDVFLFNHTAEDMEFSPDGEILGAGLGVYGSVLTDVKSGKEIRQLHGGYDNRVAFSPDGKTIATGNRKGTIWLWRVEDGEQLAALDVPDPDMLTSLDYHPSGRFVASTIWTDEGTIYIWDVEEEQIVHTLTLDNLVGSMENPFKFSPDGKIMAGAVRENREHVVRLWTVDNAEHLADLPIPKNFKDMDFSPDGSLLAIASQKATTIWDISSQELLYTLEQTFDPSVSDWMVELAFTPDGGYVAIARWDGTIELWRLPGAEPIIAPPIDMREPPALPTDVLFDTASAKLKEEAYPELEKFAKELSDNFKIATITFIGHTDSRGSEEDNLQLSLERASAIKTWIKKWADSNATVRWELLIDGRGESELKVPDTDVEGNFLESAGGMNRRVEVEIEVSN